MKLKETVENLVDVIGRILFGIVFICGVVFIADQTNAIIKNSYAEEPKIENVSSMVGFKYERVYINGKYYLVFKTDNGRNVDIEVIPLDN
jgi:hypothetical protein